MVREVQRDEHDMPVNDDVLVIGKVAHDQNGKRLGQTGYDTMHITTVRMPSHTGENFITDMVKLPSERTGFGDAADLVSATPTKWLTRNDQNVRFLDYVNDLMGQAWTTVRYLATTGKFPEFTLSTGSAMVTLFETMLAGLQKQPMPNRKGDGSGSAVITLTEALGGLAWKGEGSSVHERHWTMLRRLAYVFGLKWADKLPTLSARLESSNEANLIKIVIMFLVKFIVTMYSFYYISPIQSDRFCFTLARKRQGLLSSKIDKGLDGPLHEAWNLFMLEKKRNEWPLGSEVSDHAVYTADFVLADLVRGESIEDSIHEYLATYVVADEGLKLARQMWGGGEYTSRGDNVHFANLFSVGCYTSVGAGGGLSADPDHGLTHWQLGIETKICQLHLRELEAFQRDWDDAIRRSKHWTWVELQEAMKGTLVPFNMIGSLNGMAENDSYRAFRAFFNFEFHDGGGWMSQCVINRLNTDGISGTDMLREHPEAGLDQFHHGYQWHHALLWPIGMVKGLNEIKRESRLWNVCAWTDNEISFLLRLGMLFQTDGDVSTLQLAGIQTRWTARSLRLVQWIDAVTQTPEFLASGVSAEVPRWERTLKQAYWNYGTYDSINFQYGWYFDPITTVPQQWWTAPRPAHIKGAELQFVDNLDKISVKQLWLLKSFSTIGGVTKPPEAKPAAIPDLKAPTTPPPAQPSLPGPSDSAAATDEEEDE